MGAFGSGLKFLCGTKVQTLDVARAAQANCSLPGQERMQRHLSVESSLARTAEISGLALLLTASSTFNSN